MNYFLDRIWEWVNMCDECSDIVLNTSVWNYDNRFEISWSFEDTFIKSTNVGGLAFFVSMIYMMKRKVTRKNVN